MMQTKNAPPGSTPGEAPTAPTATMEQGQHTTPRPNAQTRPHLVTRIQLRYESHRALAPHSSHADMGLFDYEVSVQGKPYRPPADPLEDLWNVHCWLEDNGFRLVTVNREPNGRGRDPAIYTETWHLHPADPTAEPAYTTEYTRYQRWAARHADDLEADRQADRINARRDAIVSDFEDRQLELWR